MDKRVYGVIGIKSVMANWNADFTGYPKSISNGDVFGSDKALKYTMKKMWENNGEKVLYVKSLKVEKDKKEGSKVAPKSLKERYEEIFEVEDLKKEKDSQKVLGNLFNALDVKNFGATFAEEGNNIGITGAVQIGQGFNKYEDTVSEEQQILSPFRVDKGSDKEAGSTTLGTKIVSDEAHYVYPFSVNPTVYDNFKEMGVTNGYTKEDYNKFKEVSLFSATAFNTNSKMGTENELAVFVETTSELYLPDLAQYVTFEKKEKDEITLKFDELLNSLGDEILNVEVYYNPYKLNINANINKAKYFNLFTKKEV